jgi:hypothetical protein
MTEKEADALPKGLALPAMKSEALEAAKYLMYFKHSADPGYQALCVERALDHLSNFARLSTMGSEVL